MNFVKFSSLDNTYRQREMDRLFAEGLHTGEWIVTEKIDGANFSFWCDGAEVRVASRTQFVDGTFFNCSEVIERYESKILDFCKNTNITDLVIYGELFGDGIQKRVKYGSKDFRAFDVVLNGEPINKHQAFAMTKEIGIPFAPIIVWSETFEICLDTINTFKSHLSPEGVIENTAEGYVLEPVQPKFFSTGSRVYFKNKSEKFSEVKPKTKQTTPDLTPEGQELLDDLLRYDTPSRVLSAISKIGEITSKDFGRILGVVMQDIFDEFLKDTSTEAKDVGGDEWKRINSLLQTRVKSTVRNEFTRII